MHYPPCIPNGGRVAGSATIFKSICDIMRRGSVTSAVQYVPELTWMLFIRVLDEIEQREQVEAPVLGITFTPSLLEPYRWRDWGAPDGATRKELEEKPQGAFFIPGLHPA